MKVSLLIACRGKDPGRGVLELPEAQAAEALLRECAGVFDNYAERVYSTLHAPTQTALQMNGD